MSADANAAAAVAAAEVDAAALEEAWPRTVKLAHPVQFGDMSITELVLRRGRVGDMKGIRLRDDLPSDDLVTIVSRLSGQPTKVIESLDMDDAGEVIEAALDFYKRYLATGRKGSR